MERIEIAERADWRATADRFGFRFADMYGAKYWDESAMFSFTLEEVERDLEEPTAELHRLCLRLAERAHSDERLLTLLGVPAERHAYVAASWKAGDRSLYGRFDLAYDGTGPAKMLEYNADTPTGLYETGAFQWIWLDQMVERGLLPKGTDQFNSVHDRLVARFAEYPKASIFHFAGSLDDVEDHGTLMYLAECAAQGGHRTQLVDEDRIGIDAYGRLTDLEDRVIDRMFKLTPWESVFEGEYAPYLAGSGCAVVEPAWKAMLSTKAILPLLWEMFPGHPNLLPAFFEDDPRAAKLENFARKPIFSREGANVTLSLDGERTEVDGPYGDCPFVVQEATRLFRSEHGHAVVGSWVVGDEPAGIGIREDTSAVTMNLSRFVPHVIAA